MKAAALLLVCLLAYVCDAKYVHKKISSSSDLIYLSKFCFAKDKTADGNMSITITSEQADGLTIVTYLDWDNTWPKVYKKDISCEEKLKLASKSVQVVSNQVVHYLMSDKARDHYWYVALSNCKNLSVSAEVTMLFKQAEPGWNQQFSADEQNLELISLLFSLFFAFFVLVNLYADYQFVKAQSFHPIIRLFSLVLVFELVSTGSYFVHYAIYSKDGVGNGFLHFVGSAFDFFSEIGMTILLILIASGWGITYPTISHIHDKRILLAVTFGIYFILYTSMFFWSAFGLDPASTLYVYASTPGIIILVLRFMTMILFAVCLFKTLSQESDEGKRSFYIKFGVAFALWFLSLPFLVVIAQTLESWVRAKIVYGLYNTFQAIFLSILGFLLWPSRVAKHFEVAVPEMISHGYDRIGDL